MKSGMIASELVFKELTSDNLTEISDLSKSFQNSWAGKELKKARNVRPSFRFGLKIGMILSGIDQVSEEMLLDS